MKKRVLAALVCAGVVVATSGCKKKKPVGTDPPTPTTVGTSATTKPTASVPKAPTAPPVPQNFIGEVEAAKLLEGVDAEWRKPASQRDCKKIMTSVNAAMGALGPTTPQTKRAFYAGARCSEALGNYPLVAQMGGALAAVDPEYEKNAFVPRALMNMGKTQDAAQLLVALDKKHPREPEILFTGALMLRQQKKWDALLKVADATVGAVKASKEPEVQSFGWRAEGLRVMGYLNTGELDRAEKAIGSMEKLGAPPPTTESMRKALVPVKMNKVGVEAEVPKEIYLGTYHLYGHSSVVGNLFDVTLYNFTGKDQQVKVEMEIPGVTDRFVKTVPILNKKSEHLDATPPLKADFKPAEQRSERPGQVSVKVTLLGDKEKVVYDESLPTRIFPRDQLPLAQRAAKAFSVAWVTPQAKAIETFMTNAKQRLPAGTAMAGVLGPTLPQVRAIFDELKSRGFSYVLVTDFGASNAQHARLPTETLESTNALCLDGALLFATLFEKIGIQPVLVFVPGHAFVGWHASPADKQPPGTLYFLETTMVATNTFEEVTKKGLDEYMRAKAMKYFDSGSASLVDVLEMRKLGITPQPWE